MFQGFRLQRKIRYLFFVSPQQAAQLFSTSQNDFVLWGQLEKFSETSIKEFCSNASQAILVYIPDGTFILDNFYITADSFNFFFTSDLFLVHSANIGPTWSVANIKRNVEAGLITSKIVCLVESLLDYRSGHFLFCLLHDRPRHIVSNLIL